MKRLPITTEMDRIVVMHDEDIEQVRIEVTERRHVPPEKGKEQPIGFRSREVSLRKSEILAIAKELR